MTSPDYLATAVLTEHLGFPPIAVIDDVINAVNVIMYKCTEAMEKYLIDRQTKRAQYLKRQSNPGGMGVDDDDDDDDINNILKEPFVTSDEIKIGTGKLETLLETEVSKNFDKFELYCLRNLFGIPSELLEHGMFRLKHHQGIKFGANASADTLASYDENIKKLLVDIQQELNLRKILKLQIVKAEKLIGLLTKYKNIYNFLKNPQTSESLEILKSLQPLEENLFYVIDQSYDLIELVKSIQTKLTKRVEDGGVRNLRLHPTSRQKYLQGKSYKLLESMGVLEEGNLNLNFNLHSVADPSNEGGFFHSMVLDTIAANDLESAKAIGEAISQQVDSDIEILPSP